MHPVEPRTSSWSLETATRHFPCSGKYTMYIPQAGRHHLARTTRTLAAESPMRTSVRKWGNSLGLRIPRGIAEDAGLTDGSLLDLRVENGRLIGEPVAVENLHALLARVTSR